jgi:transcriptional regulator NrdR family protein
MNLQPSKPVEEPEDQRGLRCPKCGCENFSVIYTRRTWGGKIMRSRECRHCGRRVITYERVAF